MAFTKITGPGIHTLSNIMTNNVKSSGIITAVNGNLSGWLAVGSTASFGGNVSIGGTLTYDDVTNVEAVGIITAKAGIHVGAAGTVLHAINDSNVAKVGIGTTIPTAKLEISHPTHTSLVRLKRTTGNAGDFVMQIGGSNPGVIFDAVGISSDFIFQTQGNEIMRIDSLNKEVGIGTDNPFSLLDVFRKATGEDKDIFSVRSHSGAFLVQCSDVAAANPTWALRTFSGEDLVFSPGGNANTNEKMRIEASTGNIGMGLTSTSGAICDPDDNALLIRAASTFQTNHGHIMLTGDGSDVGQGPQIVFSESGSGANWAGAYIGHVRKGGGSQGDLVFGTRESTGSSSTVPEERLRIMQDGKVGIGTSDPRSGFKLDVNGDLSLGESGGTDNTYLEQKQNGDLHIINSGRAANGSTVSITGGAGGIGINRYNTLAGDTTYFRDFTVYNGKSTKVLMVDGSTSRVGIGTDAPEEILHIHENSTSACDVRISNSEGYGFLRSDSNLLAYNAQLHLFANRDRSEEYMRITNDGKIGIGTISPTGKLEINTASSTEMITLNVSNVNFARIGHNSSSGTAVLDVRSEGHTRFLTNGNNERLRIKSDGKIKFATDDSSTDYLEYGSNPRLWLRCPSNMNGLRIDASTTPLQIRNSDATGRSISVGGAPNTDMSISGDYSLSAGEYDSSPTLFFNATRHNGTTTVTTFQTSIKAVATSNTNNTGYLGLGASASPDDLVILTSGIIGIGNTVPEGKGIDIKHDRTTAYAKTSDQRDKAQLIIRNGSDAAGRFSSMSFVSGGGTQAEGSINMVQTGNYTGDFRFKLRAGGGSTDWRERFRITSNGIVHQSNGNSSLTWSRQTGRAQQGNAAAVTYTIKEFYYGTATFKIGLSDGNNKWAHFVVEIGGFQYSVSNGYNATIVANSTGNGPSISTNQQDGGYHITITNGGNSNILYGSWVLEGTSYTDASTPTLVTS